MKEYLSLRYKELNQIFTNSDLPIEFVVLDDSDNEMIELSAASLFVGCLFFSKLIRLWSKGNLESFSL